MMSGITVLNLPEISFCKIDEKDLYVEVRVNSEFTVGPLEFLGEDKGKSKYSFRVTSEQILDKDSESIVDLSAEYQSDENKSISDQHLSKKLEDDAQLLTSTVTPDIDEKNIPKIDSHTLETSIEEKVSKTQKNKIKRETSPKKTKKTCKVDEVKIELRKDYDVESNTVCDTVKIEEDNKNISNLLEDEVKLSNPEEHDADNFDDLDSELKDMDEEEIHSAEPPHVIPDTLDEIKVKSEHKESQTHVHLVKKPVTAKKRKINKETKEKKAEEDVRPKRKYTKRNAYSHDNTNYTVATNEAGLVAYKCSVCGLEIQHLGNMRDHIRAHTGERPFECSKCGKTFANQTNYNKHVVLHSDERPHICDLCGMSFKVKRQLTLHVNRHNSKGSKICQVCGKSFHSTTELKYHFDTHSSEKNYKCDVCGNLFSHRNSLKRHMLIHTGGGSHQCHICGVNLTRRFAFKKHLMKVHNIPKESVESMAPKLKDTKRVSKVHDKADTEQIYAPDENVVTIQNVPFITLNEMGGEPVYINLEDTNFEIQYLDSIDNLSTVYLQTTNEKEIMLDSKVEISNDEIQI